MDANRLELLLERQNMMYGGDAWSIAIIRHGYLVREYFPFGSASHKRFDIASGTKSFTGTAWGLLLDQSRRGALPGAQQVTLDSPAYAHLPEGHPLSDPRKERILIRHLLTMTSGIPGESLGLYGTSVDTGNGPFEHALGRCDNRLGRSAATLASEPGTNWDYSDPAISHLSLIFAHLMGREIDDYLAEKVLGPIGLEGASWDQLGGGGFIGPHTCPTSGLHISAREEARFAYLMLHGGMWGQQQLVPRWWLELATRSSQELNPKYGFTWWVNTDGSHWPALPRDTFALAGYNSNRCYIVPSLDLIVARVGSGPSNWEEQGLLTGVAATIVDG
jgi:CubicO group peptidase (beta-lactamase class C family)